MRTIANSHRWYSIMLVGGLSYGVAITVNDALVDKSASPVAVDFRPLRDVQHTPENNVTLDLETSSRQQPSTPVASMPWSQPFAMTETSIFPSDILEKSDFVVQTPDIEATNESLALKTMKAVCSMCGHVIEHLQKHAVAAASIDDLSALDTDANYQYRLTLENICPECLDAIEFAEDSMFGRLLSVDEMQALIASPTLASLKEAACTAGYANYKQQRESSTSEKGAVCEIGNSVDEKI